MLWATNVPEWIVLQFALAKIGAILVTANTALRATRHRLPAAAERGGDGRDDRAGSATWTTSARSDEIGADARRDSRRCDRLFFIGRDEAAPPGFTHYEALRAAPRTCPTPSSTRAARRSASTT